LFDIIHKEAENIDCKILEINGEEDHIHFLLDTPPTVCLSSLIGKLKAKSASAFLDKFGSVFWAQHSRTLWSSGYFVCSTGGVTLEILKKYIEQQGETNPP
jgi:putative transposase